MTHVSMNPSRWLIAAAVLIVAGLACNAAGSDTGSPTVTHDPGIVSPTGGDSGGVAVTQPPAADPTAACPQATADTKLFVSVENGYCFLVPSTMIQSQPDFMYPNDVTGFHGQVLDPNAMESFSASISVSINAPAEGLDSLTYANKWVDASFNNGGQPGLVPAVEITEATIGGQPAAVA